MAGFAWGLILAAAVMAVGRAFGSELSSLSESNVSVAVETAGLDLENLMRIKVYTVAKHLQPWFDSPAAVHVITAEEIQRSGATTLPEILRLVPGVNVARVNVHAWAVSTRGFNSLFSDKLLVMIDGRSVYTPMFSGVWWNAQDTVLADIDRIEIVRGVGGTLWGANAVNGVINIITKNARKTQGVLLSGGGGTEERGFGSFRYGGQLDSHTAFRLYGKGFARVEDYQFAGMAGQAQWQQGRSGFRLDREVGPSQWTLQGEAFTDRSEGVGVYADLDSPSLMLIDQQEWLCSRGAHLLGRWSATTLQAGDWSLQAYYDFERHDHRYAIQEQRHSADVELQHRFSWGDSHAFTWGVGYRASLDEFTPTLALSFAPPERTLHLATLYLQDEILLVPERWRLVLGARVEHNSYTQLEFLPNLRLLWQPSDRQSFWASISRAVRMPARADRDLRLNLTAVDPASLLQLQGSTGFESEQVLGFELGYRANPWPRLTVDLAVFYNIYEDLRGLQPATPYPEGDLLVLPVQYRNVYDAQTYGLELALDWQLTNWWRARASYSFLEMNQRATQPGVEPFSSDGASPRHQLSLRQAWELPARCQLDAGLRWVAALPAFGLASYWAADARLAWRPSPHWELAVVGQHLGPTHFEFGQNLVSAPAAVQAQVYGQITWRY